MPSMPLQQPGKDHRSTQPFDAPPKDTAKGHGIDRSMVAQGAHKGSHHGHYDAAEGKAGAKLSSAALMRRAADETTALDDERALAEAADDTEPMPADFVPPSQIAPFPVGARVDAWLDSADFGVEPCRYDGARGGWHPGVIAGFDAATGNLLVAFDQMPTADPVPMKPDGIRAVFSAGAWRQAPHTHQLQWRAEQAGGCMPPAEVSVADMLAYAPLRVWVAARGTVGLPAHVTSVNLPTGDALVDDLKWYIKKELAPCLDKVPKCAVQVYYRNTTADDYIIRPPYSALAENPNPEVLTDAPGLSPSCPLYWEIDAAYAGCAHPQPLAAAPVVVAGPR